MRPVRLQLALVACVTCAALGAIATSAPAETPPPAPTGWLGITFSGDDVRSVAEVTEVHPGTGAAAAGLLPGDEIIAIDGVPLGAGPGLAELVKTRRIGQRIAVTLVREGRAMRLVARLTPKPTPDELVYQWLIDRVVPAIELRDRQGGLVPLSEWARRPQVWMLFDNRCDPCAAVASTLRAHLMATEGGPVAPLRVVLFGSAPETEAYLTRVPVLGTVWRSERGSSDTDVSIMRRFLRGALDERTDGVVVVIDHHGVVRFATTVSAGDSFHDGACAAAARVMRAWRP